MYTGNCGVKNLLDLREYT